MPTIGECYNPIIAASEDNERFESLLREQGDAIFRNNPDRCQSAEDGYQAARRNLEYYCQYFSDETVAKVKSALGVGNRWVGLGGQTINNAY
jgi:hypothetical protein